MNMTRDEANIAYDTIHPTVLRAWHTESIEHHTKTLAAAKNMLRHNYVAAGIKPIVEKQATQREAFILLAS